MDVKELGLSRSKVISLLDVYIDFVTCLNGEERSNIYKSQ